MTIVVQNQSELIQADRADFEAMILPTVVFPAPGGPERMRRGPSSMGRRYPCMDWHVLSDAPTAGTGAVIDRG